MKIAYIGAFELPDKNAAAQRVISNSKALKEIGHEIILIGLSKNLEENIEFELGFKKYELNYPVSTKEWIAYLFKKDDLITIIQKENIEAVILYNYPALKYLRLKSYFKKKNIKVFADITEWYDIKINSFSNLIKYIDSSLRMRWINYNLNGLIVISGYLKKYYSTISAKVICVPPLIDLKESKWDSVSKDNSDNLNLIYAGSPGNGNKDKLDLLIRNVKNVNYENSRKIILTIVGISKEKFIEDFRISDKSLLEFLETKFVVFKGRVEHLTAIELLKKSHYSVFFRDNNLATLAGFPTKFVEAVSSRTKVITNNSSDLAIYFHKYSNIGHIIQDNNDENIQQILNSILNQERIDLINHNNDIFDYRNYLKEFTYLLSYVKS